MSSESNRPKQLEVYHTTYNLLKLVTGELKNFSRDIRQSVGNRLLGEILRLITFIYRAKNASRDLEERARHLRQLLECVNVVETLLQLSHDTQAITGDKLAEVYELTSSINNQAGAWRRDTLAALERQKLHTG